MSDYRTGGMDSTGYKNSAGEDVYIERGTNDIYSENHYGELNKTSGGSSSYNESSFEDTEESSVGNNQMIGGSHGQYYREINLPNYSTASSSKGDGEGVVIIAALAVSGVIVNAVEKMMRYSTYNAIFTTSTIILLILPYVAAKCGKKYVLINKLFMASLMFYLFPKVDAYLGLASNCKYTLTYFLDCGFHAGVTAIIIWGIYMIVEKLQTVFKI